MSRKIARRKKRVRRPRVQVRRIVRNRSSRGGVHPRIIVIHSAESRNVPGDADLRSLGGWFDNPASKVSSHLGIDDEGKTARYVPDADKAWTQAYYNPQALSIELIGRASQSAGAWTDAQVEKTARWLAFWSKKFGIPLRHSTYRGVCKHSDLGAAGGGHHDPGTFPFKRCLKRARKLKRRGW